jgi:hypothetical protein
MRIEIVPLADEVQKSEAAADEEVLISEIAADEEVQKSEAASDEVVLISEIAADEEVLMSEIAADEEVLMSEAAADEVVQKSEAAADEVVQKSEAAADEEVLMSEAAADEEVLMSETAAILDELLLLIELAALAVKAQTSEAAADEVVLMSETAAILDELLLIELAALAGEAQTSEAAADERMKYRHFCLAYAHCDRKILMLKSLFSMHDIQLCCPRQCFPKRWQDKCFECRKNETYCQKILAEDAAVDEMREEQDRKDNKRRAEDLHRALMPPLKKRYNRSVMWGWALTFRLNDEGVLERSRFKIEFKWCGGGDQDFEPLYISSTPLDNAQASENTLAAPWIFPGDFVHPDTVIRRARSEAVLTGRANSDSKLLQLSLKKDQHFNFGQGGMQLFVGNFSSELTADVRSKSTGGHTRLMVYQHHCKEHKKLGAVRIEEYKRRRHNLNFPKQRPLHDTVVRKEVICEDSQDTMLRHSSKSVAIKTAFMSQSHQFDEEKSRPHCAVYDGTELLLSSTHTPRPELTNVVGPNETELHILLRSVVFFADPRGDRELPPLPALPYKFEDKTRLVRAPDMPMAGRFCRLREEYTTYRTSRSYRIELSMHRRDPNKYAAPASYLELTNRASDWLVKKLAILKSQTTSAHVSAYNYDALLNGDASDDDDDDDDADLDIDAEDEEDDRVWGRKTRPKSKKIKKVPETGPVAEAHEKKTNATKLDRELRELYYPTENILAHHQTFDCVNRLLEVGEDGHQHAEECVYLISRHTNKWNFLMNDEGLNRLTVWEYDPSEGTRGAMSMVFSSFDDQSQLMTYVQDLRGVTNLRVTYPGGARFYADSHEFSHYDEPTIFKLRKGPSCGAHCRVFPHCGTCVRKIEVFGQVTRLYSDLDRFIDRHYLFEFPKNDSDLEEFNNVCNRKHKNNYHTAVSESDTIQRILKQQNEKRLLRLRNDEPSNLCNVELKVVSGKSKGERFPLRFTEAFHVDEYPPLYTAAVYTIGSMDREYVKGPPLCRIIFLEDSVAPRHCTISVDNQRRVWLQVDFESNYTVVIYKKDVFIKVMTSGRLELKNGYTISLGKHLENAHTAAPLPVVLKVKFNC